MAILKMRYALVAVITALFMFGVACTDEGLTTPPPQQKGDNFADGSDASEFLKLLAAGSILEIEYDTDGGNHFHYIFDSLQYGSTDPIMGLHYSMIHYRDGEPYSYYSVYIQPNYLDASYFSTLDGVGNNMYGEPGCAIIGLNLLGSLNVTQTKDPVMIENNDIISPGRKFLVNEVNGTILSYITKEPRVGITGLFTKDLRKECLPDIYKNVKITKK